LGVGEAYGPERAGARGGRRRRRDLVRKRARQLARARSQEPRPRPLRRLLVPVVPAPALAHRARERAPGGTLRRPLGHAGAAARDGALGGSRRGRPRRPLPRAALGRRAATRRLLPGGTERSPAPARR